MTAAGWTIMLASVSSILVWCGYCVYRVVTLPEKTSQQHLHARLDIDTGDLEDS